MDNDQVDIDIDTSIVLSSGSRSIESTSASYWITTAGAWGVELSPVTVHVSNFVLRVACQTSSKKA